MIESPARAANPIPACPYVGLQPFTEAERAYFFGREQDSETIAANLVSSPLTLLYGASGVGKSSVLAAGVVPYLRILPALVVVNFGTWQDPTFKAQLMDAIAREIRGATNKSFQYDASLAFDEFLVRASQATRRTLVLIFDQFEEYFLYRGPDESFEGELARAVNRAEVPTNFLFSVREDALSRLDRFEKRIPNLYSNYLRLEHLDRAGALSAIRKPLDVFNREYPNDPPVTIEDALVTELIDQVQTGGVSLGQMGVGTIAQAPGEVRVETPVLQMVLTTLWDEELGAGSHVLRLATLQRLGGANRIARTHLDHVMEKLNDAQRDTAAQLFRYMVTPSGTKIAQSVDDLAQFSDLPVQQIQPVLNLLTSPDVRILRAIAPSPGAPATATRYEIFHDALAAAILDWRRRYAAAKERAGAARKLAAEHSRVIRLRLVLIAVTLLLFLMVGLLVYALGERRRGLSRELAAQSLEQLDKDPELSVLLAIRAVNENPTQEADDALRKAVSESNVRRVLVGHTNELNDAQFSPDGKWIVTASQDKTARIWDAATGKPLWTLTGHTDEVQDARFSPDGKWVLTGSKDDTARVWNAATGASVQTLAGFKDNVKAIAIRSDGNLIAVASKDGTTRVWETKTWTVVSTLNAGSSINQVLFSPDSRLIATASDDGNAHIWNATSGASTQTLNAGKQPILDLAFSPDSTMLVTAGQDHRALLWNVGQDITPTVLTGHRQGVSNVAFSPDGTKIATGSLDFTARLWNVKTGLNEMVFIGHTARITDLSFSPDGKFLVTSSRDGTARVWDLSTGFTVALLKGHVRDVFSAAFGPDGKSVVTASRDGTARVWEANPAQTIIDAHSGNINGVTFSPDGQVLTAGNGGAAQFWNATTGITGTLLTKFKGSVNNVEFSRDGKLLLTTESHKEDESENGVHLWDASSQKPVMFIKEPTDKATFSPDARLIATLSGDNANKVWTARVWDRTTVQPLITITNNVPIFDIAFSPDGKYLATVNGETQTKSDDTVRIFVVTSGQLVRVLAGHVGPVRALAYSPDGNSIVTGSEDMDGRVWNLSTGDFIPLIGHTNWVLTAAYSRDGRFVVTGGRDDTARVWDARTGRNLAVFYGHTAAIDTAVFSPDGKSVLTGAGDGTARVFGCEACGSLDDLLQFASTRVTRSLTCEEKNKYLQANLACPTPMPEPTFQVGQ